MISDLEYIKEIVSNLKYGWRIADMTRSRLEVRLK